MKVTLGDVKKFGFTDLGCSRCDYIKMHGKAHEQFQKSLQYKVNCKRSRAEVLRVARGRRVRPAAGADADGVPGRLPCERDYVLAPAAKDRGCSFVELIASDAQRPRWVVSCGWNLPVHLMLVCLEAHARDAGLRDDEAAYWIASFAHAQHDRAMSTALAFIAVWPIGVPLVMLLLMAYSHKALMMRRATFWTRALSFLHRDYDM